MREFLATEVDQEMIQGCINILDEGIKSSTLLLMKYDMLAAYITHCRPKEDFDYLCDAVAVNKFFNIFEVSSHYYFL